MSYFPVDADLSIDYRYLPHNDDFQKNLEQKMIKNVKNYISIRPDINDIHQYYVEYRTKKASIPIPDDKKVCPLIVYIIAPEKCTVDENYTELFEKKDDRVKIMLDAFNETILWAKKQNLRVPHTRIYFWVNDAIPWLKSNFPLFVFSKPANSSYIVSPNESFFCFRADEKYAGKCYNYDEIVNLIIENDKTPFSEKENCIYFKGANTTNRNSNIRSFFAEKTKVDNRIFSKFSLDAFQNYEPFYNQAKYQWVVSLPGRVPWSPRLQNIAPMNINIIHFDQLNRDISGEYDDEPVDSFINYVIDREDINAYSFVYYPLSSKDPPHIMKLKQKLIRRNITAAYERMVQVYQDSLENPQVYEKKRKRVMAAAKTLTMDRIFQCMYLLICGNHRIFIDQNNEIPKDQN